MRQRLTPIIVEHPQRSDQWFAARLGNVTASRVADTMGYYAVNKGHLTLAKEYYALNKNLHDQDWIDKMIEEYPLEFCLQAGVEILENAARRSYRQTLVAERITKMRGDTDPYVSDDMKWGIMNEGIAIGRYQMQYKKIIKQARLMLHPDMWCGASPDAIVTDVDTGETGYAEVKCLRSSNHLYKIIKEDDMPEEYWPQVQMQMWIGGVDWCDFIGFDSRVGQGLEIFVDRIPYDEFYIDNVLQPAVRRFLDECDHEEKIFYAIKANNLKKKELTK